MADTTLLIRASSAKAVFDLLKADKTVALALAIQIADDTARADIEIYAQWHLDGDQRYFDTTRAASKEDPAGDMERITRALEYIRVRGDVFPWLMKRHIAAPSLVQFVDKEGGNV